MIVFKNYTYLYTLGHLISNFCSTFLSPKISINSLKFLFKGGAENVYGKVNILLQTHISRGNVKSFSLVSDMNYVTQNAARICRAVFEIVLRKNLPLLSGRMLRFSKVIEKQMWDFEHPLRQHPLIKQDIVSKLENRNGSHECYSNQL